MLHSYAFESRDYQVTPGSPWNYALKLQNDSQPDKDLTFASKGLELGVPPFSLKGAPGMIMAQVIHNYWFATFDCVSLFLFTPPPSRVAYWILGNCPTMQRLPHPHLLSPPPTPSHPSLSSPLEPQISGSLSCQHWLKTLNFNYCFLSVDMHWL